MFFFSSIKEIDSLTIKGMSNIYLKVTVEKSDVLETSVFEF